MNPVLRLLFTVVLIGLIAQGDVSSWRATLRGVGPIRVGMTVQDVYRVMGTDSRVSVDEMAECDYADVPGLPASIGLMTSYGRIARYEVGRPGIKTASGAEVGMSEDSVRHLYAGRMHVVPDPYDGPDSHNLIYEPSPADSEFGLIFETDGKKVIAYRAGRRPHVEYIEGCS